MKHLLSRIFISLSILALLSACQDELVYDNGTPIVDGEAIVDATIFFEDFGSARLGSRSAGDAVKQVENIAVLLYDENGTLRRSLYGTASDRGTFEALSIDQEGNTDRPNDGNTSAEQRTPSASVRFAGVENDYYKIYALANLGDVTKAGHQYHDAVQTIEGLRGIRLNWVDTGADAGNAMATNTNHAMLGYFTTDGEIHDRFDAPKVPLNRKQTLFCWLRRAVSKVTVAFDGSKLNQNITIYLQSVEIKDIPTSCLLGHDNTPGKGKEGETFDATQVTQGEKIMYSDAADYHQWPAVTRGRSKTFGLLAPGKKHDDDNRLDIPEYHDELTPALYFFENLQGTGDDKRQDPNDSGSLTHPGYPGDNTYYLKDGKPYGTYIEVTGYYRGMGSEGKIIYRFMLGKDVIKDYNAERNFHYKLTLVFNGNANDADWHIEYRQEKDMVFPDPYFISYLYKQDVMLPVTLQGSDYGNVKIVARIIENNWYPDNADIDIVTPGTEKNPGPWHGFLSLRSREAKIIGDGDKINNNPVNYNNPEWFSQDWGYTDSSGKFIEGKYPGQGRMEYPNLVPGSYTTAYGDPYNVALNDSGNIVVNIPFYTRAKNMITTSGYTGNNPFEAYQRKALVEITLYDKTTGKVITNNAGKPRRDTLTVYQVRRIENPKGIWRRYNNDEQFNVVLHERKTENSDLFTPVISEGPWRVSVESGQDWVKINGSVNGTASGDHDTQIAFTYQPNGVLTDSTQVRCGIIYIEYNNYTCHHRIFVRQGYAPIKLNDAKVRWHTFNLYSKDKEAITPTEEGSLFKFGNVDDAIAASNNQQFGNRVGPGSSKLTLAGGGSKSWGEIKSAHKKFGTANANPSFSDLTISYVRGRGNNIKARVASSTDYKNLINSADREFAYGVLYADGATSVKTSTTTAHTFTRGGDESLGMRGCFVYNTKNGNNLFFPIGATGHGRRASNQAWYGVTPPTGVLQYAWRYELYADRTQVLLRPMFNDVYRRPGATYWTQSFSRNKEGNSGSDSHAYLDINYFSFDFSVGGNEPLAPDNANNQNNTSACFIRCVEDVP
ncbi:MAG: hypothetical protein NC210_07965 [[Clostridium] fimetarium]|nr:hypothetical protein [Alistipes timonensis]MCM1406339.1 hypothetical protein [[Clostridium] fimetarium]